MEEKKYYSVDRLENGLAVLLSDEDEQLTLPVEELGGLGPAGGKDGPAGEAAARQGEPLPPKEPLTGEHPAVPEAARAEPAALPPEAAGKRPLREGDILVRVEGRWEWDDAEAARRRKKNTALLANLRRRRALK